MKHKFKVTIYVVDKGVYSATRGRMRAAFERAWAKLWLTYPLEDSDNRTTRTADKLFTSAHNTMKRCPRYTRVSETDGWTVTVDVERLPHDDA